MAFLGRALSANTSSLRLLRSLSAPLGPNNLPSGQPRSPQHQHHKELAPTVVPNAAMSLQTYTTGWAEGAEGATQQPGSTQPPLPHIPEVHDQELALEQLLGPLNSTPLLPPPKPVVIIISGPSGVGKDAVVQKLKEARSDLYFVVTATSRPMRPNEVEGRDYFFVDRPKFEGWIRDDMLLEHANVYGDYKGIPRQQVDDALKAGTDVVLRIDVQGAATVKRLMPEAITIFVTAESERSLVTRLASRKTEDMTKLALRVQTARDEVKRASEFDYIVENGTGMLEKCVSQLSSIIDAEKARTERRMAPSRS
uniref:guanylate kinase n=1 Tax=Dunaliella tertiolecta TaxID=3047 RepID=A0A7S3VHK8_DUNTE|mmetsp:Transcript_22204/g.61392  ORF Transcript_22204/g.61392 Transcript_22204/m.61392 type:complete len:310 (+) Transcript_22204:118-1047(+)